MLFSLLLKNNNNDKVQFVLPKHIRLQLSTRSASPSQINSPSVPVVEVKIESQCETKTSSVYGKRKKTDSDATIVDGDEGNETGMEGYSPQKKNNASTVKSELRRISEDPEMPPGFLKNGVSAGLPSSMEEGKPKSELRFVLEPTVEPSSLETMLPEDRQHLVNAASVLKSRLVARLTNEANNLSTDCKITLANRCYYALHELGDDYTLFRSKVDKLIEQQEELESFLREKESWNDMVIMDRYDEQVMNVSDVTKKVSNAEDKLSKAKTNVGSIKCKREELTVALLKLQEELHEEEERVKILTAEWDRYKEAQSDAEAELRKLDREKEKARVAFKAINDQYNTAKEKCEKLYNKLLQLSRSDKVTFLNVGKLSNHNVFKGFTISTMF
ncbi:hypothetical protein DCAR_0104359 [Daucus carota subsp. sativus]|uniref:Uncharacterized protein n=1 Tax=Daucus carota subsp. sativus TaxID=79200 RepID=A0A166IS51_DAUCS|nr:hypothetical protein DCAR_0104359 [Daucus carota subsp. sativus]